MKVLMCGDRAWTSFAKIDAEVKKLTTEDLVIEGGAPGADSMAGESAMTHGIPLMVIPAQWYFYKKAAGPIRNGWMLKFGQPDKVIAFHSNIETSKGTANMVKQALKKGIPVKVIK